MFYRALPVLALMFLAPSLAAADALSDLDRGHRLLLERGLQLQALILDTGPLDLSTWADSNFTTANLWALPNMVTLGAAPGIPWARWFGGHEVDVNPDLSPAEQPYLSNLVSVQLGDEQDLNNTEARQRTVDAFDFWRANYPGTIHMLSQQLKYMDVLAPHMDAIQPDLVAGGSYRQNNQEIFLGEPIRRGGSPQKMYKEMLSLRAVCLEGHAGSASQPIPYGVFTQLFYQSSDSDYAKIVSESQMRLQAMASWAAGCKWTCGFIYNNVPGPGGPHASDLLPVIFGEGGDWYAPTDRFAIIRQLNFESLNLGPALLRLLSTDVRMVRGRYNNPLCFLPEGGVAPCQETIPLAQGMNEWAPGVDPYITSITQTNLGQENDGLPGDVLVGYFKPLHEDFDGPAHTGEQYFMIVNSMAFTDATSAETRQAIVVDFDFGSSGITTLQRLSRFTGGVETVPLQPLGNHRYRLTLHYGGGEGDLYKFNTGAPFILANEPQASPSFAVTIGGEAYHEIIIGAALTLETIATTQGSDSIVYQWYRDTGAKMPELIANADSATFQLEDAAYADSGAYWCEVTDGTFSATSNVVTISVVAPIPVGNAWGLAALCSIFASGLALMTRRVRLA